jgi:hypothetical protein
MIMVTRNGPSTSVSPMADTEIRPFQFHASDAALADLRHRIAATDWPEGELVTDASRGVQLATYRNSHTTGRRNTTGAGLKHD